MAFGYDGSIRIDTKINQKGFNTGINSMVSSLGKLAAAAGLAFGVAALINFGRESVKAASQLSSALTGLQSIVEGQGRSFSQAKGFIKDYISDGLIPMQNAVTAYKNLAMRGYGTEQIEQTMIALKNSATFGRQASLTMGEAVASATEGLKNENSILVDNSGVTKNVSMMWKDYAEKLGVGVQSLTKQQRIQAEVNGIMEETRFQMGDAAKAVNTYSGQMAMLSFNFTQLKVAVGEAIIPIVQAVLPSVNTLISKMTELANVAAQVTTALFGKSPAKDQAEDEKDLAEAGKDATDANEDLAGATDEMGNAVEKAGKKVKGSLAPFDDLKKLAGSAADSVSDAADDINKGDGFDDLNQKLFGNVEVSPEILSFIEKLKNALQEVANILDRFWKPFKDSWKKYGASVISALKRALSSVWELIKAIGKTFLEMWEKLGAEKVLDVILKMLAGILDFVSGLAEQFRTVWDQMGEGLVEALFFAVSSVLELIASIGGAFAEAWNSGIGEKILENILSILTNIFNVIGTIAVKLREAWEVNNNGVEIWKSVLTVINDVLIFIDRISAATFVWASGLNLEPVVTSFNNLLKAIEPLVGLLLGELAWAFENVLLPLGGWIIEDAVPAAIDLVSAAVKGLTAVLDALAPAGESFISGFLAPIAAFTGELFIFAMESITELLTDLSNWAYENQEAIKAMAMVVTAFFAVFIGSKIITAIMGISVVLGDFVFLLSQMNIMTILTKGSLGLLAGAAALVAMAWKDMSGWQKVVSVLALLTAGALAAAVAVGALQSAWSLGVAALAIVAGIIAITAAVNSAGSKAASMSKNVSIGSVGGGSGGGMRNIPQMSSYSVPHLANGAVIPPNQQFLAVLGDQRRGVNVEAPLTTIEQAVTNAMQKNGGMGSGPTTIDIHLDLDGREIWRSQQAVQKQMGTSLVGG